MKLSVLLFVTLIITIPVIAQDNSAPVDTTLRQTLSYDDLKISTVAEAWMINYNQGNAAQVAELYTEDGYYLSAHILAHGRAAIQAYWERGIAAGGHIDFIKPLTVYHSTDLGFFAGTYQATNAGVTVDGRILIVVKKVNDKWLIAAHETVVRDQP
jgi:ketosteroid isomerase-like protein